MKRDAKLQEKANELQIELRRWAVRQRWLRPGEQLLLSITVRSFETAVVEVGTETSAGRSDEKTAKGDATWRILTEKEWLSVEKLPWIPEDRFLLSVFVKYPGQPITEEAIKANLPAEFKYSQKIWFRHDGGGTTLDREKVRTRINAFFKKQKLVLRIRQTGYKSGDLVLCELD